MNHPAAVFQLFYRSRMILRRMTNLESYLLHRNLARKEMEIVERKILLVGRLRIITMTHIQDVVLYILLNHKPGTAAKA
ncbi:Uncharacterised protein [Segatella copri]|nr:Uncharacterised protein [Segatella copri]